MHTNVKCQLPLPTDAMGLSRDERGLSTIEYVIILVLIAAAAIGAWQVLGQTIMTKLCQSNAAIGNMQGTLIDCSSLGNTQSSGTSASDTGQATPVPAQASPKGPKKKVDD